MTLSGLECDLHQCFLIVRLWPKSVSWSCVDGVIFHICSYDNLDEGLLHCCTIFLHLREKKRVLWTTF